MTDLAREILDRLLAVSAERQRRLASPELSRAVLAVKEYQQSRFRLTYSDLLSDPRYGQAARFFLEELYGPRDFSRRDEQFARVVPATVRLFPREVVETIATLAELHLLSEQLDSAMGEQLGSGEMSASRYVSCWNAIDHAALRERQVDLTLDIGHSLDRLTRKPLLRQMLQMMRAPARAAGLEELQRFLETGFDAFRAMRGAEEFLRTIAFRERSLISLLFEVQVLRDGGLPIPLTEKLP